MDLFTKGEILLDNLVSNLLNPVNYMIENVYGFETWLRNIAPPLLDIYGIICHPVHNVMKKVCHFFFFFFFWENEYLMEIHEYKQSSVNTADVTYITLKQIISHRWLGFTLPTIQMMSSLTRIWKNVKQSSSTEVITRKWKNRKLIKEDLQRNTRITKKFSICATKSYFILIYASKPFPFLGCSY